MTYQPVIPIGGNAGWAFLKRTQAQQQTALQASPAIKRDETYFREKIGKITTAEQLVSDRRLLRVALTAFGLESDIDSKAFIKKVLADGTLKEGALALKLTDTRYRELSAAFGFGDFSTPRTKLSDFADKILTKYQTKTFETAVGNQNSAFRLAMNAERELPVLAAKTGSDDAKWFTVMGNRPIRELMQTALGLPSTMAGLDIDRQLTAFKARAKATFGAETVSQFTDPDKMAKLTRIFLARSETSGSVGSFSSASSAIQLLSGFQG